MGLRINPQTGQLEDDGLGPGLATPADLAQGYQQGPPPSPLPQQLPLAPSPQVQPQPAARPPTPTPMVRDTSTSQWSREVPRPEEAGLVSQQTANDEAAVRIAGQKGEADVAKAGAEAAAARERAAARGEFQQQTGQLVQDNRSLVEAAKAKYDAENQKLIEIGDPKDWWSQQTTGRKVAAAIGLAMSAIGGALTGKGGNAALDVINHNIELDYRMQMAKIAQQEKRAGAAKEGVQMARQAGSDARDNLELEQAAKWNQLGAYADARAAQVGTPAAAAMAANIKNMAEEKKNEHALKYYEGLRSKASGGSTSVQGPGTAGAQAATQTAIFDLAGNYVGNAFRPDEAEKIRAGQAATNNLLGTIQDIKQFNAGHNWATRKGPDAMKQADALSAAAAGYLTSMFQSGVLNQGEFERYKSMTQPGILQGGEGANKVLDTLGQEVTRSYENRVRSQNVQRPQAGGQAPAGAQGQQGGAPQGAVRVTQRNRRTGETREVWQLPDGSIVP